MWKQQLPLASENDLIQRSQNGDEQAFEALILSYSPPLYKIIIRLVSDDAEAEAVIQEAFWRVWRALGYYQNDRPFFPYLVKVALNYLRDRWRAGHLREENTVDIEEVGDQIMDPVPAPERKVIESEAREFLIQALDKLPAIYKKVIVLRYQAGLSYVEIAEYLNVPLNTVRTHLRRAKERLRLFMEEYERV
jgi:RNA polymerase sigma-70 factor (ECF subfamily)